MSDLSARIAEQRAELDHLRPLAGEALVQLQHFYDVELTYTSNAIEGNTLTARETAEVIEHGITVGGKKLRDHLEAQDHYDAIGWMRGVAATGEPIGELTVTELHRRIILRSQPKIAGVYSDHRRRIAGSAVIFPNPLKLPALMAEFGDWLASVEPTFDAAFEAHLRLVSIHPFSDGNGRTARLLMNLLLIRGGDPPIAVRPEDRTRYLEAIERTRLADDAAAYHELLSERLLATLEDYVATLKESVPRP